MCPFSILAFLQPTTVDKEPLFLSENLIRFSLLFSYEQQAQIRSRHLKVQVLLG